MRSEPKRTNGNLLYTWIPVVIVTVFKIPNPDEFQDVGNLARFNIRLILFVEVKQLEYNGREITKSKKTFLLKNESKSNICMKLSKLA